MNIFYHPEDGRMGDIIPYYEDGIFKLFYLGFGWSNISTRDQLHFTDPFRTEIRGGTGSVLRVDGEYHMFYCKFTFTPYMRQYVCHAVSGDLKQWKELPEETFQPDGIIYEMSDWRDPHVIWNEEEQCWIGRSYADSPDIDGEVHFDGASREGDMALVRITAAEDGILYGEEADT